MEWGDSHLRAPRDLCETPGLSNQPDSSTCLHYQNNHHEWSSLQLHLAHLIRGTSIISSSNPHKLTVQGEREAAPARVHRVQALCGAQVLAAPQRLRPHKGNCVLISVLSAPLHSALPSHSCSHSVGTRRPAGHSSGTAPAARRVGMAHNALRCLPGTQMPALPLLAPRRPPQKGQPST